MSTRTLVISLVPHPMGRYGTMRGAISIDGVPQEFAWRTGQWTVPADRPVAVAVMFFDEQGTRRGFAEYTLDPAQPAELEYRAPAFVTAPGALGPRGTVQHQGAGSYAHWVSFGVLAVVLGAGAVTAVALLLSLR